MLFNFQFKWSEPDEYFVFPKDNDKIEVFSLETKSIEFHINSEENIVFLLEQPKQMVLIDISQIFLWELKKLLKLKNSNMML